MPHHRPEDKDESHNDKQDAVELANLRQADSRRRCSNCRFRPQQTCTLFHFDPADNETCDEHQFDTEDKPVGVDIPEANQMITNEIMTISLNASLLRRGTRNGREHLVVPFVAAIESVMNGRLITEDELEKSIPSLNGRPLVVPHPQKNGEFVSANRPDVITIGNVFNSVMDGRKLKGEAWFDIELLRRAGAAGRQIITKLQSNRVIETSLGWFQNAIKRVGIFNGRQYTEIAINLVHDHLAVLLDTEGSCSIEDGCGIVRNQIISPSPDAEHTDFFVSIDISDDVAQRIAIPGHIPANKMHVSLAFGGNAHELSDDLMGAAIANIAGVVSTHPVLIGKIGGLGRFNGSGTHNGKDAIFALVDVPGLSELRNDIVLAMKTARIPVSDDHGFTPHVTLSFVPIGDPSPIDKMNDIPIEISGVTVSVGNKSTIFPLSGPSEVMESIMMNLLQVNILSKARRPQFDDTEELAWSDVDKTLGAFVSAFFERTSADIPDDGPPSSVQDMPENMKTWIAAHTLLGNANEENERDLTFFPVVNPMTGNLNQGALRAVLGGRGDSADIPVTARESAQDMARSLLDGQFETNEKAVSALMRFLTDFRNKFIKENDSMTEQTPCSDTPDVVTNEQLTAFEGRLETVVSSIAELNDSVKGLSEIVNNGRQDSRQKLIDNLVANQQCPLPQTVLDTMTLESLQETGKAYKAVAPDVYFGAGGFPAPAVNSENGDWVEA